MQKRFKRKSNPLQSRGNIIAIIKEKNLKVRNVAHDSDLDIEALRRYILGKQIMGIDKLIRISKALNVEISELFRNL
ncbi:helix-turn-helix domain-containing protein [Flavobacterium limnophilum]|uniref:helix-turn-helix domain-containing protein n=1 Tax=Flavobacterium limnophilum TaxID=3003262 RepID=UPI0022AC0DDB|nr:helix-turn-helix transcriptional regulator [Flavobacterium limnophilum]